MDYMIRNHKNVYIKLNEKGKAVTCSEHEKGIFEYIKARNIVEFLKKTLKRLNFSVEPVPDTDVQMGTNTTQAACSDTEQIIQSSKEIETEKKNVIESENYELSESISVWIEKFGICSDILNEAKQRKEMLVDELNKSDDKLLDILHEIELEPAKDLYGGWLLYKRIRSNRKKRREIKDETLIIQNVLEEIEPSCLERKRVQKAVEGLFKRKYVYKIIEEEEEAE